MLKADNIISYKIGYMSLNLRQFEKDSESRVKDKITMGDKGDSDHLGDGQKGGLNMDDGSFGDTDGANFGVGLASRDNRASKGELLKITRKNRSQAKAGTRQS